MKANEVVLVSSLNNKISDIIEEIRKQYGEEEQRIIFPVTNRILEELLFNKTLEAENASENIKTAIEKQTAMRVYKHHSHYTGDTYKGVCPRCYSVEDSSANYCRVCGQALNFCEE